MKAHDGEGCGTKNPLTENRPGQMSQSNPGQALNMFRNRITQVSQITTLFSCI